jgi:A/G-specific adenine glycosylase
MNAHDLPWRAPGEPLARRGLVEGLLAQTRASAVAGEYAAIFHEVATCADWLDLTEEQRGARVAPLGLPRLKLAAVDGIARTMNPWGGYIVDQTLYAQLLAQPGIGPYTASMVTLLMGGEAAPVDCNVQRVADRCDPAAGAAPWIAEVVAAVGVGTRVAALDALRAGYVAVSAVLDLGVTVCRVGAAPACERCPLEVHCAFALAGTRQIGWRW